MCLTVRRKRLIPICITPLTFVDRNFFINKTIKLILFLPFSWPLFVPVYFLHFGFILGLICNFPHVFNHSKQQFDNIKLHLLTVWSTYVMPIIPKTPFENLTWYKYQTQIDQKHLKILTPMTVTRCLSFLSLSPSVYTFLCTRLKLRIKSLSTCTVNETIKEYIFFWPHKPKSTAHDSSKIH